MVARTVVVGRPGPRVDYHRSRSRVLVRTLTEACAGRASDRPLRSPLPLPAGLAFSRGLLPLQLLHQRRHRRLQGGELLDDLEAVCLCRGRDLAIKGRRVENRQPGIALEIT